MAILKIEPFSGISGDMILGSLASLTDNLDLITELPKNLGLEDEVEVTFEKVKRSSISCNKANVTLLKEQKHNHRHLPSIIKIIDEAKIKTEAKELAKEIFGYLAQAEAESHNIPIEKVHFHEVGALDSIVDIIGAAVLITEISPEKVICGPVCTGFGYVDSDHGTLPIPAPATEKLLQGMPTITGSIESEMTTPTGAAILKALKPEFSNTQVISKKSSWGAGTKEFNLVNALRVSLCEEASSTKDQVWLIQTNLDDLPAEQLGHDLQERLISKGAIDVTLTPCQMKKGRPGIILEVITSTENKDKLADIILEHTTTLGVRFIPCERKILPREIVSVETSYGPVRIKKATLPSGGTRSIPEYEDCRAAAKNGDIPVHNVYLEALSKS